MNKEQILTKAIEKAIANGWDDEMALRFKLPKDDYSAWDGFDEDGWYRSGKYDEHDEQLSILEVIFDHDFAKALWGNNDFEYLPLNQVKPLEFDNNIPKFDYRDYVVRLPAWQYHLQQMVVADDPIEYLGRNM